jgi:hypothetical protein
MDLLYDSDKLEKVGSNPLTYTSLFGNGRSVPDITVPGIVNELGAFSSFNVGPGRDPQLLGTLRMRVKASGQAAISTNPAENASRGFTIFKEDTAVPSTLISFGTLNLPIGQNFIAANDTFNFDEDSSNNSLAVLDNDTIVAGSNAVLTVQSLGTPSKGGTVSIASDNKRVIYTPAANINGQETFTYTVRDQTGATASATVTVQLRAVNDNPVAVNDSLGTVKTTDRDVFIPVLTNDTLGPDTGETLTVTQVGTPNQGGTVRLGTGGNGVIYNPRAGFTGNETFTYTISDRNGGTSTATVTVTVSPAVPPPTVAGESFTIVEDAAGAEFNVLSNDLPAQTGDTLSITDTKSSNGTATITSNGTRLTFAPKANFADQELVVYTVRSSNGGLANGTATFTVTPVNDPPLAVDDSFSPLSSPNQSLDVLANDPLADAGDIYTITAITQPETGKGTVQIGPNGKTLLYSAPSIDFSGPVVFTYTVSDGTLTNKASVTLNVQNFTPRDLEIAFPPFFRDLPVTVEVVGAAGSNSTTIPIIPTNAGVKISNVGPGDYRFSIPDLPFVSGGAQEIMVTSAFNDSSSVTPAFNSGTRDARFVDLRDFMGQNLKRGITSAVAANKESAWVDGQGDWKNFKNIKVSLNTAGDQLTVRATNPSNQNVQATLPVSDPKVVMRGKEGDASLFRIQAHPSQLTFTPSTSTASLSTFATNTPDSETDNTGASGEGEQGTAAPPVTNDRRESVSLNPALVDQVIQQVKAPQRMIASSNAPDSSKRIESKSLPSQPASAPVSSNPISNGFRRGFRTR